MITRQQNSASCARVLPGCGAALLPGGIVINRSHKDNIHTEFYWGRSYQVIPHVRPLTKCPGGISILGVTQKLSGCGPEQGALVITFLRIICCKVPV